MNSIYIEANTIMFLLSCGLIISALAIYYLHLQHKNIQGIFFWAIAYICISFALGLIGLREQVPSYLSVLLSNVFLFIGFFLFYYSSCLYTKKLPQFKLPLVAVIFLCIPFLFLYQSEEYIGFRTILTHIYVCIFSFMTASVLSTNNSNNISTQKITSGLFYTESVIHASVVIGVSLGQFANIEWFAQSQSKMYLGYETVIASSVISVGVLILVSIALVMMVAEQLRNNLEEHLNEIEAARKLAELTITEQRNFYAMISHEFKTPISIITASSEIILMNLPDSDSESKEEVDRINRSSNRLNAIVDNVLNEDYLDSYHETNKLQSISLRNVLNKLKKEYSFELLFSTDSDFIIQANPHTLPHAFANLVDNAIKYGSNDAAVRVNCQQKLQEKITVEVIDDGGGINVDEKELIFEKYYRSKQAYNKQGSGLGLYHVKRIIDSHHAYIENEQINEHNVFRVVFPINS